MNIIKRCLLIMSVATLLMPLCSFSFVPETVQVSKSHAVEIRPWMPSKEGFRSNKALEGRAAMELSLSQEPPRPTQEPVAQVFSASAYDLSVASCAKARNDPAYGITKTGIDLQGKDLRNRYISVDPNVIELGSTVYVEALSGNRYWTMADGTVVDFNGYYTAVDTGSGIKGNEVDIFFGEDVNGLFYNTMCFSFGRRTIHIYVNPNQNGG